MPDEDRDENQREPGPGCMFGVQTLPKENGTGASLLQLPLSWGSTMSDNYNSRAIR